MKFNYKIAGKQSFINASIFTFGFWLVSYFTENVRTVESLLMSFIVFSILFFAMRYFTHKYFKTSES